MKKPSQVDLTITGGQVYRRGKLTRLDIAVDGGRIVKLGRKPNMPKTCETVKAEGYLVLPGLIDVHVHLRDQRLSYKETFETGTASAALGGVTTVFDMPNNDPPTVGSYALRERIAEAEGRIYVNVGFYSFIPEDPYEAKAAVEAGAVGFKIFLTDGEGLNPWNEALLLEGLETVGKMKSRVSIHPEDGRIIRDRASKVTVKRIEDFKSIRIKEAELSAVKYMVKTLSKVKVKPHIHFCHITYLETAKMIAEARKAGLPVSCEATPHHLLLDDSTLGRIGKIAFTYPLLREPGEPEALMEALSTGLIDIVASDHAPHSLEEKTVEDPVKVKPGFPGLEVMLPVMFTQTVKGRLSLKKLVEALCENPARIFKLDRRGRIEEGFYADLVVLDPRRRFTVDPRFFASKAKYSPFEGWEVRGKPVATIVGGVVVAEEGELLGKPAGRIVKAAVDGSIR